MQTLNDVKDYIDQQLAKIEEGKIEIEVEKIKIGYLKQRNNVDKNEIDIRRVTLKEMELNSIGKKITDTV